MDIESKQPKPTTQVNLRMNVNIVERLKDIARKQSVEQGRDVRWTDLLRESVAARFMMTLPKEKQ